MKKLATLATLMAGVGLAFGQTTVHQVGVVSFQNTESVKAPGVPSHLVTNGLGGTVTLLVGTQYNAELYYMDTTLNSLQPIASTISSFKSTTTATGKGTWNGPQAPTPLPLGYGGIDTVPDPDSGLPVETGDGTGVGSGYYPVDMRVRVWDSTTGATWETATIRGESALFSYVQRWTANPPAVTDTQMLTQRAFTIVPEPSAIALSIIGVAGLLLIRRRK